MSSLITQKLNEAIAIPDVGIQPGNATATLTSGGVDMQKFARVRFNLFLGKTSDTITMNLRQSATSDLGSPSDIADTTITVTGSATAGRVGSVELKPEMMTAGQRYVYAEVEGADTTGIPLCVFVEGAPAYHAPASQFNNAAVVTQISVP